MTSPSRSQGRFVEVARIEHSYDRTTALRGVSMSAGAGEVVAVTGPSGCGKSTLLHVAAGLLPAQAGRASLLGADLAGLDETARVRLRRRDVGIVLQYGQLVPDLSLVDNVALPLLLEQVELSAARTAAADWLARAGLAGYQDARPAQISGGQAQRAAVARALVASPQVVFADEPVASLDVQGGAEMLELLTGVARDRGGVLVLITHDNTVASVADREIRLREGKVEHEVTL